MLFKKSSKNINYTPFGICAPIGFELEVNIEDFTFIFNPSKVFNRLCNICKNACKELGYEKGRYYIELSRFLTEQIQTIVNKKLKDIELSENEYLLMDHLTNFLDEFVSENIKNVILE